MFKNSESSLCIKCNKRPLTSSSIENSHRFTSWCLLWSVSTICMWKPLWIFIKIFRNLSYLIKKKVEYTLVMTHYYGSLSLFIKRLTIPSHVQMLPVIWGFQVVSVLMNECQHEAETLDGVLIVFVLYELTKKILKTKLMKFYN